MFASNRSRALPILQAALLFAVSLPGCGQPVREDRSIHWSGKGEAVGFQHGEEGVFVADREGGKLQKIFQPDATVLATSTPLWSPRDKRLVFTTARDPNGTGRPTGQSAGPFNPSGMIHYQRPVVYTCWLRDNDDTDNPPKALFEAACNHIGYVAANLAVRWHPDGDRVLFVNQFAGGHGLFEYDLKSAESRRVFPYTADAMIFDWSPDGSRLVCVLGSVAGSRETDGIWIGRPGDDQWWQVPASGMLAQGQLPSLLERLRETRPAWTPDGTRFAFASFEPARADTRTERHFLWLVNAPTREVERCAQGEQPFTHLHWSPDGLRLGLVRGRGAGSLHWLRPGSPLSDPINQRPVRGFAGWNDSGEHLAYVVPDAIPHAANDTWSFLLPPNRFARDAVLIADGHGTEAGREVFAGMCVTFPRWSPRDAKLSLWVTFTPTHQSWLSRLLGWSLRPGDPAAVLDMASGEMGWMAINPHEKAQVGHYYLLKRDYQWAWQWYEQAEREAPALPPRMPRQILDELAGPRDSSFFQYYCLTKLGRADEAQAKLDQFEQRFLPRRPEPDDQRPSDAGAVRSESAWERSIAEVLKPDGLGAALLQDLYMAEVLLSLDAAEDACEFFQKRMAAAPTDAARLSSAIVLGQVLLVLDQRREFADLTTDTIVPLALAAWEPRAAGALTSSIDTQWLLAIAGTMTLTPLYTPKFLAGLPPEHLQALAPRWEAHRPKARDDTTNLAIDLFLDAAYQQLGQEADRQAAATRVEKNPARQEWHPENLTEWIKELRNMFELETD